MEFDAKFDYVIVGGGSAGCVLASRLTENPDISVCLLEYGGEGKDLAIRVPASVAPPGNDDSYGAAFYAGWWRQRDESAYPRRRATKSVSAWRASRFSASSTIHGLNAHGVAASALNMVARSTH